MSGRVHVERQFYNEFFDPVWARRWRHNGIDAQEFRSELRSKRASSGLGVDDPFKVFFYSDSVTTLTVRNGNTLQEHLILSEFPKNEESIRALGEQLCIGLLRLHDGVQERHGMLSPFNIRISADGVASLWSVPTLSLERGARLERRREDKKVGGWLKAGEKRALGFHTRTGHKGILKRDQAARYLAPEEPNGSFLSDVYSVGAILYRCLLGDLAVSELPNDTSKGKRLEALGLSEGLVDIVLKCLQADPLDRFLGIRKLAQALVPGGTASRLDIKSGRELVNRGIRYSQNAELELAMAAFVEAKDKDDLSVAVWNNIAATRMRQGEWLSAVYDLEKAYNLSPTHPVVSSNVSYCFCHLKDKVAVEFWAQQAMSMNPRLVRPFLSRGELALVGGSPEQAFPHATGAVLANPKSYLARSFLIRVYEAMGMSAQAKLEKSQLAALGKDWPFSDCLIDEERDVPWFITAGSSDTDGDQGSSNVPRGPHGPRPSRSAAISFEEEGEVK